MPTDGARQSREPQRMHHLLYQQQLIKEEQQRAKNSSSKTEDTIVISPVDLAPVFRYRERASSLVATSSSFATGECSAQHQPDIATAATTTATMSPPPPTFPSSRDRDVFNTTPPSATKANPTLYTSMPVLMSDVTYSDYQPWHHDTFLLDMWAQQQQDGSFAACDASFDPLREWTGALGTDDPTLATRPLDINIGENPVDFMARYPSTSLSMYAAPLHHNGSGSSSCLQPPSPTTASLTDATTTTTSMSRQASLDSELGLAMMQTGSVDMVRLPSRSMFVGNGSGSRDEYGNAPVSTRSHDVLGLSYSSATPTTLLGPGHQATISSVAMERSTSNTSSTSTSSTQSRCKQRLQNSNAAASRPIMPKTVAAGDGTHAMARTGLMESSTSQLSHSEPYPASASASTTITTTTTTKVPLPNPLPSATATASSSTRYQRPRHSRLYCPLCTSHPSGFRGEHELRRHTDRQHATTTVKRYICVEPEDLHDGGKGGSGKGGGRKHPTPVLPLGGCKACMKGDSNGGKEGESKYGNGKRYNAYYNAAAHLRRTHFRLRNTNTTNGSNGGGGGKGRRDSNASGNGKGSGGSSGGSTGGGGGGDWPPMSELKTWWIREVVERVPVKTLPKDGEGEGKMMDVEYEEEQNLDCWNEPDPNPDLELDSWHEQNQHHARRQQEQNFDLSMMTRNNEAVIPDVDVDMMFARENYNMSMAMGGGGMGMELMAYDGMELDIGMAVDMDLGMGSDLRFLPSC